MPKLANFFAGLFLGISFSIILVNAQGATTTKEIIIDEKASTTPPIIYPKSYEQITALGKINITALDEQEVVSNFNFLDDKLTEKNNLISKYSRLYDSCKNK